MEEKESISNLHVWKSRASISALMGLEFHFFSQICSIQEVKDPPDSSLADTSDSCSIDVVAQMMLVRMTYLEKVAEEKEVEKLASINERN
ncbi:hypothetical protein NC652_000015 [Populus alba x Populus x berolinensis]|nr:hypothetical protein NC652_000015 [Populus alba x Populus x berolinensis]